MNLVKRGYGVRIQVVSSDSSQLVMEIAGDCNEPGQPRKCEVLLATFFLEMRNGNGGVGV